MWPPTMRQTTTASISICAPPTTNRSLTCVTTSSSPKGVMEIGSTSKVSPVTPPSFAKKA